MCFLFEMHLLVDVVLICTKPTHTSFCVKKSKEKKELGKNHLQEEAQVTKKNSSSVPGVQTYCSCSCWANVSH